MHHHRALNSRGAEQFGRQASEDIYSIPFLSAARCALAKFAFQLRESKLKPALSALSWCTIKYAYLDGLHRLFRLHKLHVDLAPEPR